MEITEKQFRAFVGVRDSGLTNMLDGRMVSILSGGICTDEVSIAIIERFDELAKKFQVGER